MIVTRLLHTSFVVGAPTRAHRGANRGACLRQPIWHAPRAPVRAPANVMPCRRMVVVMLAASECVAFTRKVPSIEAWARLDTVGVEERVLAEKEVSKQWRPQTARVAKFTLNVVDRFGGVGVYHSKPKTGAAVGAGGGSVRVVLSEHPYKSVKIPAQRVQHACYGHTVTVPYEADRVDVRCMQLLRDTARLLQAGAFDARIPSAPVGVHPATVVMLRHLGFRETVPLGILVLLHVWAAANMVQYVMSVRHGEGALPWHAAVATGVGYAWAVFQMCPWRAGAGESATFMSVLAALPRALLMRLESAFDARKWDTYMKADGCREVRPVSWPACTDAFVWGAAFSPPLHCDPLVGVCPRATHAALCFPAVSRLGPTPCW